MTNADSLKAHLDGCAHAVLSDASNRCFLGISAPPGSGARGVLDTFTLLATEAGWRVHSIASPDKPLGSAARAPLLLTVGGLAGAGLRGTEEYPSASDWMDALKRLGAAGRTAVIVPPAAAARLAEDAHIPGRLKWLPALFKADLVVLCSTPTGWLLLERSWPALGLPLPLLPAPRSIPPISNETARGLLRGASGRLSSDALDALARAVGPHIGQLTLAAGCLSRLEEPARVGVDDVEALLHQWFTVECHERFWQAWTFHHIGNKDSAATRALALLTEGSPLDEESLRAACALGVVDRRGALRSPAFLRWFRSRVQKQGVPQRSRVLTRRPPRLDPSPPAWGGVGTSPRPRWCVASTTSGTVLGDGDKLYVRGMMGVAALRAADGEALWTCSTERWETSSDNDTSAVPILQRGPFLFVAGQAHITVVDSRGGHPHRFLRAPKVSAMAVCGTHLFAVQDAGAALICFDWTTGQRLKLTGLPDVINLWQLVDAGDDLVITTAIGVLRLRRKGATLSVVWHNRELREAIAAQRVGELLVTTAHCPAVLDLTTGATRWHKPRTRTDFGIPVPDAVVLGRTKLKGARIDTTLLCLDMSDGSKRWGAKVPYERGNVVATDALLIGVARRGDSIHDVTLEARSLAKGRKVFTAPQLTYQLSNELTPMLPETVSLVAPDRLVTTTHSGAMIAWAL